MLTKLNQSTFVFDHEFYLNKIYKSCLICQKENLLVQLRIKKEHFNLSEPHILQSNSCENIKSKQENNVSTDGHAISVSNDNKSKKRKRKRKFPLNKGEIASLEYHANIYPHLRYAYECFKLYKEKSYNETSSCNKLKVNECGSQCLNLVCLKCSGMIDSFISSGSMLQNCQNFPIVFRNSNQSYVCPAKSSFVVSDIKQTQALIENAESFGKFNCIVADPPWENKSVKRGRKYCWLTNQQIKDYLPVPRIMSDTCLIVVWVTNKQKIMKFVKDEVFKKWGFKYLTEWHWVKVTKTGKPVFPFESTHKKPYETMLVGCTPSMEEYLTKNSIDVHNKVIFSVPSETHSHKPPLNEVLSLIFAQFEVDPKFIELFARSLTPGWVSWGNETLKMQHLSYFDSSDIL